MGSSTRLDLVTILLSKVLFLRSSNALFSLYSVMMSMSVVAVDEAESRRAPRPPPRVDKLVVEPATLLEAAAMLCSDAKCLLRRSSAVILVRGLGNTGEVGD